MLVLVAKLLLHSILFFFRPQNIVEQCVAENIKVNVWSVYN